MRKEIKIGMEFSLVLEASEGVAHKTSSVHALSDKVASYFSDKDYGCDVKEIIIGMIIVAPEFEWFATVRKPKYTSYRKHMRDGIEIVADRLFCFDLKIEYDSFKNQTDKQNENMLAQKILESLSILESLPKKVKDFDKDRFKEDIEIFFKQSSLL